MVARNCMHCHQLSLCIGALQDRPRVLEFQARKSGVRAYTSTDAARAHLFIESQNMLGDRNGIETNKRRMLTILLPPINWQRNAIEITWELNPKTLARSEPYTFRDPTLV